MTREYYIKIADLLVRYLLLALLVFVVYTAFLHGCQGGGNAVSDTLGVRIDSIRDTVYVEIHDTAPSFKRERITGYAKIPADSLHVSRDVSNKTDSLYTLPVVQREYSDSDSTYTAWVSGIRYREWPRLDSIAVRSRTVTERITETVTIRQKPSRWSVGLTGGYGLGLQSQRIEPFVGVGVTYRIFPP